MAILAGKTDAAPQEGYALADKSTLNRLRELALEGTELAKAPCHTIRLKLLKIGAAIRITVRKIWVSLSTSYLYADTFTASKFPKLLANSSP